LRREALSVVEIITVLVIISQTMTVPQPH
jgi:hypothetical protein